MEEELPAFYVANLPVPTYMWSVNVYPHGSARNISPLQQNAIIMVAVEDQIPIMTHPDLPRITRFIPYSCSVLATLDCQLE